MLFIHRDISKHLLKAARSFPSIILTGPRRSGKTFLLKKLFPKAKYFLLEDPNVVSLLRSDPRGFLDDLTGPVIFDELQNFPELLNYIRALIDAKPSKNGQWLMTGSQEAPLMKGVSESMAGRAAVFQLYPFSLHENSKVSFLKGGFPEVVKKPSIKDIWFRSYIQTYLERDVRSIIAVKDLVTFRKFLSILASRCGRMLNKTDIAAPLGISVATLSQWLGVLESTGQIIIVPPFYENFGKRLVKSPKVYFLDSGLLCHLLEIHNDKMLSESSFKGAIFEGFAAAEIVKNQINNGKRKEIYYFRDEQGLEVDFLVPRANGGLALCEVKSSKTIWPQDIAAMKKLSKGIKSRPVKCFLITPCTTQLPHLQSVEILSFDHVRALTE